MKCAEVKSYCGHYLDSELDVRTSIEIGRHLEECPECSGIFEEETAFCERLSGLLRKGQSTPALWEQTYRLVLASLDRLDKLPKTLSANTPMGWWRTWLWPCPQFYAGLAAVWVLMLAVNYSISEPQNVPTSKDLTASGEIIKALVQQRRELAELLELTDVPVVTPQLGLPRPRSEGLEWTPFLNLQLSLNLIAAGVRRLLCLSGEAIKGYMNISIDKASLSQRSPILRLCRWLFSAAGLRICLCVLACLVTLACLCYVMINWRGKRAWEAYRQGMAAQGERLELAAFIPPPVPDEQNFAITPFLAPLYDFRPGSQTWRDTNSLKQVQGFAHEFPEAPSKSANWRIGKQTDWAVWQTTLQERTNRLAKSKKAPDVVADPAQSRTVAAAVLEAMTEYEAVLEELRAASRCPYSRFNIRYEHRNPLEILLPHLPVLKRIVRILSLRASAELALGKTDQALNDIILACHLIDAIRNEPFLISHLVRIAGLQLVMQPLWEGLAGRQWSEAQLQALQTLLQKFDFLIDLRQVLRGERALGNGVIMLLRNKPELLATLGMGNDSAAQPPATPRFLFNLIPRGWFYREQLSYNRIFQELIIPGANLEARRVEPSISKQNEKAMEKLCGERFSVATSHRLFAGMLLPFLARAHQKFAYAQSIVDQAVIACGLERHRQANGQFPDRLEALAPRYMGKLPHDVIKGEPLNYRLTAGGHFVLYSVGWNEKDDGGAAGLTKKGGWDISEGDWTWSY